ncbi:MAG: 5-oxoprolinase subunit PxpA [Flavisolibacter sp.]
MFQCDINCDLGEGFPSDEAVMPFITSANIACGYHAGNEIIMHQTLLLCQKYNVAIGAHPSYRDRENFGRLELDLSAKDLYDLLTKQILDLKKIADGHGSRLHHVKPHGALYNLAAKDESTAKVVAQAIKDLDEHLILYGLSGSILLREALAIGLKTASEGFADRSYQNDGSLTPRGQVGAIISDEKQSMYQVLQMIKEGSVTSLSGKVIPITVQTICLHGDGTHTYAFAKKIRQTLEQNNIAIKAVSF